jgi:23S rRNA (cytidine1920-2'-O)/16S rRNA (cytidine1409-2'-O)-methyltransferase
MDGGVLVNGVKITKPGTPIKDGAKIELTNDWRPQKYVSRGGHKLEKALTEFGVDVSGKICLDVGASTGGFTDCLLQAGAAYVYAVDVGYGQIAWSLRTDSRVKVIERTNARAITPEILRGESESYIAPELAVIDVSFISLSKVLPATKSCLAQDSFQILALVKPQFEAGPEKVGKGGVVRSSEVHIEVLHNAISEAASLGLYAQKLTFSPLKGPQGNIEFLVLLRTAGELAVGADTIESVVQAATKTLT